MGCHFLLISSKQVQEYMLKRASYELFKVGIDECTIFLPHTTRRKCNKHIQ